MKELTENQEYESLVEEAKNLLSERHFDLQLRDVEWRLELGRLVTNSPFYARNQKGNGVSISKLAADIGISQSSLYECILFSKKFKSMEEVMKLDTGHKSIRWVRDIRPRLVTSPSKCPHNETEEEDLIIHRVRCVLCGRVLSEEKSKR